MLSHISLQYGLGLQQPAVVVQVISEVLCLARNPSVVKRLADEKEELFVSLIKDRKPGSAPGVMQLLETLRKHDVRCLSAEARAHAVYF